METPFVIALKVHLDHMCIWGIELPSVIIRNQSLKCDAFLIPKRVDAKRDDVINHHGNNFNEFQTENWDVLKTLRINRSQPLNFDTCALGDLWSTSSDTQLV